MRALFFLAVLLLAAYWLWGLRRAATLFRVVVREGRIARTSGRIPARLLAEIADIIELSGVTQATIIAVRRDGKPVLEFKGEMSPGSQQQVRNVVGQLTVREIQNGPRRG